MSANGAHEDTSAPLRAHKPAGNWDDNDSRFRRPNVSASKEKPVLQPITCIIRCGSSQPKESLMATKLKIVEDEAGVDQTTVGHIVSTPALPKMATSRETSPSL